MKSIFFLLVFSAFSGTLVAQNHLYFSIGGNYTTSTFPAFKVSGMSDYSNQGRLGMLSALSYQHQIREKFAVGLGLQAAQRSYYIGVNKESNPKTKSGGYKFLYIGLMPQLSYAIHTKFSLNFGLPFSYLADTKLYNSVTEKWVAAPSSLKETYNKIDIGLQPGIQFNLTDRFALNLEAYYGIPSVNKDLTITDINGIDLETVKDHNIGLSLSLKHRIF